MKFTCICCGKELKHAFDFTQHGEIKHINEARDIQPSGGLHCITFGHYGSRIFDPFNGDMLNFIVCDDCMEIALKKKICYITDINKKIKDDGEIEE